MSIKKWEKYRILFQYGLAMEEEIAHQIQRYKREDIDVLVRDILCDMAKMVVPDSYVIKLVPEELQLKLKNYIIHSKLDLQKAKTEIERRTDYAEIWWCKTHRTAEGTGVFGRLYINSGGCTELGQYVEQIWADTSRDIDRLGQEISFIRAYRPWWGWRYCIRSYNYAEVERSMAITCFSDVVNQIEQKRDGIEQLTEDLNKLNICSFDIEYKIINGIVNIIDWDSPADQRAIGGLL